MSENRENKPMTFVLFPNKYKNSAKHPDMMGRFFDADGNEFQLAGWALNGRNGTFYSGKVTPVDEAKKYKRVNNPENKPNKQDDIDDLPFGI